MTASDSGILFFTDAARRQVFRWNDPERKAEVIAETKGQPMVAGFASPSTLLIVEYERAVQSLNIAESGAALQPVAETAGKLPGTVLLLPVGLHNKFSILKDLMEHRDYVYRQGSNTAVISVVENAAGGTSTHRGQRRRSSRAGLGARSCRVQTWPPSRQAMNSA